MYESEGDDKSVNRSSKEIELQYSRVSFLSFCNVGLLTSVLVDWVVLQWSRAKNSRFGQNSMMTGIGLSTKN